MSTAARRNHGRAAILNGNPATDTQPLQQVLPAVRLPSLPPPQVCLRKAHERDFRPVLPPRGELPHVPPHADVDAYVVLMRECWEFEPTARSARSVACGIIVAVGVSFVLAARAQRTGAPHRCSYNPACAHQ